MQIIECKDKSVNFIDEDDVFVGYDLGQSCCEVASWFFVVDGAALDDETPPPDPESLKFDKDFFEDNNDVDHDNETPQVKFRLTDGSREVFLVLVNSHNGYYGHGFEFKDGPNELQSGWI